MRKDPIKISDARHEVDCECAVCIELDQTVNTLRLVTLERDAAIRERDEAVALLRALFDAATALDDGIPESVAEAANIYDEVCDLAHARVDTQAFLSRLDAKAGA